MPRGDPRSAALPVRLTVAEKAQLYEYAKDHDLALSEAARHAIQSVYHINRNEARRQQQAKLLSRLGELLAETRRIGGLYALQAKSSRPVPATSQTLLDDAIAAIGRAMGDLLA